VNKVVASKARRKTAKDPDKGEGNRLLIKEKGRLSIHGNQG
jgi:hypothetical protein